MNEVDLYIRQFPSEVQEILLKIRSLIIKHAPASEEYMGYGIPGYKLNNKPLVYFAAYKNHIGFYATPSGHNFFKPELAPYKQGKGSVQFPLNKPIPYDLLEKIVKFKVQENNETRK